MKLGDTIQEIREREKNFKRSYVAEKLHISTRAYCNIENDVAEITVSRLKEIAKILECSTHYILNYKKTKQQYLTTFNNNNGNQGIIHINQASQDEQFNKVERLLCELLDCERKRIRLLESLLTYHNIKF